MLLFRYLCVALICVFSGCIAEEAPATPKVLHYVQDHLPKSGVLKLSEGFLYVDVDDAYIHKLISFIEEQGYEEPPYFGGPEMAGAHISVVYAEESKEYGLGEIEECGMTIAFTPKECQVVHPSKWKKVEAVYLIVVEAPELDRIRVKYGLPKREYDFHITVGIKPKC